MNKPVAEFQQNPPPGRPPAPARQAAASGAWSPAAAGAPKQAGFRPARPTEAGSAARSPAARVEVGRPNLPARCPLAAGFDSRFIPCALSSAADVASLRCIVHGGYLKRRCVEPGCDKEGLSRTRKCAVHGGGRRCEEPGCGQPTPTKSAKRCRAHGGGKVCGVGGCAQRGYCSAHTKRCLEPGCPKKANGPNKRCKAHGGGRRCEEPGCDKSGQGVAKRWAPQQTRPPLGHPMSPPPFGTGVL